MLAYVDFRKAILQGELPQVTCLLGTMVQEAYDPHPAIRAACDRYISEHAAAARLRHRGGSGALCARGRMVARERRALLAGRAAGRLVLAKAKHGPKVAADCLDHPKRYFEALLGTRALRAERESVQ